MKKRLFSWLLVLAMVLSVMPTVAFADNEAEDPDVLFHESFDNYDTGNPTLVAKGDASQYTQEAKTLEGGETVLSVSASTNTVSNDATLEVDETFGAGSYVVTARMKTEGAKGGATIIELPGVKVNGNKYCLWIDTNSDVLRARVRPGNATDNTLTDNNLKTGVAETEWATVTIYVTSGDAASVRYVIDQGGDAVIEYAITSGVKVGGDQKVAFRILNTTGTRTVYLDDVSACLHPEVMFHENFDNYDTANPTLVVNGELADKYTQSVEALEGTGEKVLSVSATAADVTTGLKVNKTFDDDSYMFATRVKAAGSGQTIIELPGVEVGGRGYAIWIDNYKDVMRARIRLRNSSGGFVNYTVNSNAVSVSGEASEAEWATVKIFVTNGVTDAVRFVIDQGNGSVLEYAITSNVEVAGDQTVLFTVSGEERTVYIDDITVRRWAPEVLFYEDFNAFDADAAYTPGADNAQFELSDSASEKYTMTTTTKDGLDALSVSAEDATSIFIDTKETFSGNYAVEFRVKTEGVGQLTLLNMPGVKTIKPDTTGSASTFNIQIANSIGIRVRDAANHSRIVAQSQGVDDEWVTVKVTVDKTNDKVTTEVWHEDMTRWGDAYVLTGDYAAEFIDGKQIRFNVNGSADNVRTTYFDYIKVTCLHTYDEGTVTEPTCVADGYTVYTCTDCGYTYTEAGDPATNEHNQDVTIKAVAPTYTADGWTEGKKCSVCGAVSVEPEIDPMKTGDEHSVEEYAQYNTNGTAPTKDGCVFAGWYADSSCTSLYTEGDVVYAKFVNEKTLTTKFQLTKDTAADWDSTKMRIVSTVDSENYARAGFTLTVGEESREYSFNKAYKTIVANNGNDEFGHKPNVFSEDSLAFVTYTFEMPKDSFETKFTVTAWWETLDGVRVYGAPRTESVITLIGLSNETTPAAE